MPRSDVGMYEDEIDLADYLKVLIKRKWLIVVGTVVCAVAAVGYKSLQTPPPPQFEAQAILMVMPPVIKTELSPPQYSMEVYQALALAEDLIEAVIDTLGLQNPGGGKLPILALSSALEATIVAKDGSSLMALKVASRDTGGLPPVETANAWADLFVQRNDGIVYREVVGSSDYILEQYQTADRKLEEAQEALNEFDRRFGLTEMRTEFEARTRKLKEYQNAAVDGSLQLAADEKILSDLEPHLAAQETAGGDWIGSLDSVEGVGLKGGASDRPQDRVRRAVVEARDRLRDLEARLATFNSKHDLDLARRDLASKRGNLLGYVSEISSLEVGASSIAEVLEQTSRSSGDERLNPPPVSGVSETVIRELASLQMRHNLLRPRQQHLLKETEALRPIIDSLQVVVSTGERELGRITAKKAVAEAIYHQWASEYLATRKRADALRLSTSRLRPRLERSTQTVETLSRAVGSLRGELTALEAERARLNRNVELISSTYNKFAQLSEDARVAKAERPSDLKIAARAVVFRQVDEEARRQVVTLAAAVGLVLSVFLAFFLEYLDKARDRLAAE